MSDDSKKRKNFNDIMGYMMEQTRMLHPLFLPSGKLGKDGKNDPQYDWSRGVSKGACQICGGGQGNERCWYTGDWLCERCKKRYSKEREWSMLDRYVSGMIECSRALRDWNTDRWWAIVPYKARS